MKTNKYIIIGKVENNLFFDKEAFNEYLQLIRNIRRWEYEELEEIKNTIKLYETPGDFSLLTK